MFVSGVSFVSFVIEHLISLLLVGLFVFVVLILFYNRRIKRDLVFCKKKLLQAEEANKAKDKLFSIVAHDLRSPFNSLLGLSEMLMLQSESLNIDQVKSYSRQMHSSTHNLYTLVEDLLQWSRTQTGSTSYHPAKIDLNILINNIVNLSRISAQEKDIVIALSLDNGLEAMADAHIFSTVLRNLINNALKYSKVGSTVNITGSRDNDGYILITVSDTGVGMNASQLNKVFKIDERWSTSGTFNEPGSGLGLVLCKEFVEINKGQIRVDSIEGVGTTVSFTIPSLEYA